MRNVVFILFHSFSRLLPGLAAGALRALELFIPPGGARRPSAVAFGTIKRGENGRFERRNGSAGTARNGKSSTITARLRLPVAAVTKRSDLMVRRDGN